jgi:predicted RNA binding protein YcfA (HicA-like mRNA interferase family)
VKRKDVLKILEVNGALLLRHGADHDIYIHTVTKRQAPVPRQKEIDNQLVRIIIKQLTQD